MLKQPHKNRFVYFGGLSVILEILQNKYDLIIFKGGTRFIGPICALIAKLSKAKTVLWEQNSLHTTNTFLKKFVKSIYINDKIFDKFIAYGDHVKELILSFSPKANIFNVLSPIDNETYRNRYLKLEKKKNLIRKKLDLNKEAKIILFIGRFVEQKNLFSLLTAAEKLKESDNPVKFLLVGGGDLEKELEEKITQMDINKEIKIIPFQHFNKLTMFYTIADLFVLPSSFEPWGLVVNEAMSYGCPAIVSDKCGCVPELVTDGETGWGPGQAKGWGTRLTPAA